MLLNYILRKCTGDTIFLKSLGKLITQCSSCLQKMKKTNKNDKNIQCGYRIWHRKICHGHNEKWKKTKELPNQVKIRTLGRKKNN